MNAIKVGLAVNSVLSNSTSLNSIIQGRVFPNIVPDEEEDGDDRIPFPLVVYYRTVEPQDSKTCESDTAIVTIDCYSNDYPEVVEIASIVAEELRGSSGNIAGISIRGVKLLSVTEEYVNPYKQTLIFKIL